MLNKRSKSGGTVLSHHSSPPVMASNMGHYCHQFRYLYVYIFGHMANFAKKPGNIICDIYWHQTMQW